MTTVSQNLGNGRIYDQIKPEKFFETKNMKVVVAHAVDNGGGLGMRGTALVPHVHREIPDQNVFSIRFNQGWSLRSKRKGWTGATTVIEKVDFDADDDIIRFVGAVYYKNGYGGSKKPFCIIFTPEIVKRVNCRFTETPLAELKAKLPKLKDLGFGYAD